MARLKTRSNIAGKVLENTLKLHHTTLKNRNVTNQSAKDEPLSYDFAEVIEKCDELIYLQLKQKYCNDAGIDADDLRKEKLRQEIRKLKLSNDVRDGTLVEASDVEITYTKAIRRIIDKLDTLTSRVKMENPNVTPSQLDSINRCLIEIRNEMAEGDY